MGSLWLRVSPLPYAQIDLAGHHAFHSLVTVASQICQQVVESDTLVMVCNILLRSHFLVSCGHL